MNAIDDHARDSYKRSLSTVSVKVEDDGQDSFASEQLPKRPRVTAPHNQTGPYPRPHQVSELC